VDIAAYLAAPELARFRVIVGPDHAIHAVRTVAELEVVVRRRAIDVLVIDPQFPRNAELDLLGALLARHAALPVVAYVAVSAEGMRRTLMLTAFGLRHVVLRSYEDEPDGFWTVIARARSDTLTESLLGRLGPQLDALPVSLAGATRMLFRAPHTVRNVATLARLAGFQRRTCSRALARVGLVPGRFLVRAARVLRAYHYLRGGTDRVADVAARLGYGTPDALVTASRSITGLRPSVLARTLGPEALVAHMAKRLSRRPATRDDSPGTDAPTDHQPVAGPPARHG
jgi:AraC-like DNA-binding protein